MRPFELLKPDGTGVLPSFIAAFIWIFTVAGEYPPNLRFSRCAAPHEPRQLELRR
jgi:hypothetical protein